jgi:hypothetical protein
VNETFFVRQGAWLAVRAFAMSKSQKNKLSKQQRSREELSDEQLGTVSGGVIAIIAPQARDEGPEENITFVYGKLSIADPNQFAAKK